MEYRNDNAEELLAYIDPSSLDYQQWCGIGMALKDAGYDVSLWDSWSARDPARYHSGECAKKWRTFNGADTPVTFGTIVKMAIDGGFRDSISAGRALSWDDCIGEECVITSPDTTENVPIREPKIWSPVDEVRRYIETLFEPSDTVAYAVSSYKNEKGRYVPNDKGVYTRTAADILKALTICGGDLGAALGDYDPMAGGWVRINPMDGQGVKNVNVTDFRYALVESDSLPLEQQNGIIRDLQLPVAALVYTGGKSLHAVVRVSASNSKEYSERVSFLYSVCNKNGLQIDSNNRNPSRLSRLPGLIRGDRKQFIVDTNIGLPTWEAWRDYIDSITDDLPDFVNVADVWDNLPELSPPLIDGILRQGHKMLLAGPSKAGKSFALIELAIAIAEGRKWLGWQCTKGKVLYANFELDSPSCFHRIVDVYKALGIPPENKRNIVVWNLRGVTEPMDKLAPKLIRRARKENYIAVIIDPIYKVITGDENSADQMAHFCNQFDKVCTQLGCAVIYCHHHSKGSQGGKRSMDRASGSGVFARDPDALLDMAELDLTEEIIKQVQNNEGCGVCVEHLKRHAPGALEDASQDDLCSRRELLRICYDNLSRDDYEGLKRALDACDKRVKQMTAWRMEGTLREFPKFEPRDLWFRYPYHEADTVGILRDLQTEVQMTTYQKGSKRGHERQSRMAKAKRADKNAELMNVFNVCNVGGNVTVQDMAEYLGVDRRTVERRLKDSAELELDNGNIRRRK